MSYASTYLADEFYRGTAPDQCDTCNGNGVIEVPANCGHWRGCDCGGETATCGACGGTGEAAA